MTDRLDDETRYPPGSIGAMFPEAAAVMEQLLRERNALEAENERLRAMIPNCTCPASSMFEGPSRGCPTHGGAALGPAGADHQEQP